MNRLRRSLTARLVLTAVGVALLGAAATLGVAYQLVRTATVHESQSVLRSTARVVAAEPSAGRAALVRNLDRAHTRGIRLVLVRTDGTTVPAGSLVPHAAVTALQTDGAVSERFGAGGSTYLLEGIRVSGGDAVIAYQDFSVVRSSIARLFDRVLAATLLGAVVAGVIGALVAGRVVRPLRRTAATAGRLAAGERGLPPAPETTLADVAAIDAALAALEEALRSSEGRQREFLLSVSHEMRTPLTGIRGYADALADGLVEPDRVAEVGRTLVTETTRLDAFVRDLLELSRLQADDFPIRTETFRIVPLVRGSMEAWRAAADDAGVTVELHGGEAEGLSCTSDPMRVRQLLDGLVENALRASPPRSTIRVAVSATDGTGVRLSVRDEGSGLTAEDIPDAFARGVLANRYRNTRPVGTGLGLSIAARLVERLGGRIDASSTGTGTEFAIVIPGSTDAGS